MNPSKGLDNPRGGAHNGDMKERVIKSICVWYVNGQRCRRAAKWRCDGYEVCDRCRIEDHILGRIAVAVNIATGEVVRSI